MFPTKTKKKGELNYDEVVDVLISADDCTYNEKYIEFSSDYVFYSWGGEMDDATLEKIADSVEFTD